ncbi:hypothetical protein M8818_007479 [Zalaria obscura]|uniref:Uncharacterized protein n=1 Tax=Zalaria obscura TaxID=2024903 RepID=A0ACC3S3C1_9PEZI
METDRGTEHQQAAMSMSDQDEHALSPVSSNDTAVPADQNENADAEIATDESLHDQEDHPPSLILDLGTGSGIWAMQVADQYPSAEVIGTDISPVQPKWVPPNLQYEVDDLEQEWLFRDDCFDLIHVRFMFLSIKDWPGMLRQAMRVLKPGGYIELSELDLRPVKVQDGSPEPATITQWFKLQGGAINHRGFDMQIAHKFKGLLEQAGFEAVVEEVRDVPWGTWPSDKRLKSIGFWHVEQLKQGLQGIAMATLTRSGWSVAEVEVFLASLRREMSDPQYHILDHAYIVYGRKPLS